MNTVQLVGRLTKDVDLKFTQTGEAVANFTIAVNRNFTNQQGEREADFINCVIWRKSAENLANFTRKGSLIGLDGRLQTRSYDNQQGQRVYVTEVVVNHFDLLEKKPDYAQNAPNYGQAQAQPINQGIYTSQPQNVTQANFGQNNQFLDEGHPIDISEDDLPF